MDKNKNILVTNLEKKFENYNQFTWNSFLKAITNQAVAFNVEDNQTVYIDAECVPSEDMANQLNSAFETIAWIAFEEGNIPSWFTFGVNALPSDLKVDAFTSAQQRELDNVMGIFDHDPSEEEDDGEKIGKIITFGSAKGGSGKTFTSIITAYYYAKEHPTEKVCLLDLDVEEPQVALVIKQLTPNIKKFYGSYQLGKTSFDDMKKCKANSPNMPKNLDFYLTPRDANPILDQKFWETVMTNLFYNYDMVFLDTGTTYMLTAPIITAYKVADKICLVTMASLASSVAVDNQIKRLVGDTENDVYSKDDQLEPKINLIVTNSYQDPITESIVNKMGEEAPIIACFGNFHKEINRIQILGEWNHFDNNDGFRQGIRNIFTM